MSLYRNNLTALPLVCTAAALIVCLGACVVGRESFNGPAIRLSTVATLIALAAVCPDALRTGRIGPVVLLAGVLLSFWLGAWRCMSRAYAPASATLWSEFGGLWPARTVARAILYVSLFQFVSLAACFAAPPLRRPAVLLRRLDRPVGHDLRVPLVFLAIAAMFAVLLIRSGGSPSGLLDILAGSRTASASARRIGPLMHVVWLGYCGVAIGLSDLLLTRRPLRIRLILACIVAAGAIVVLADGTRHRLLYVFGPPCLILLHLSVARGRRYRWILPAAVLFCVAAYQGQSLCRDTGWRTLASHDRRDLLHLSGTDQFQPLLYALELMGARGRHLHTPAWPFFLTHWVPRRLWPAKPHQPALELFSRTRTGAAELAVRNATPSLLGQYHINWGVFGVAWIALCMGLAAGLLDRLARDGPLTDAPFAWTLLGMLWAFLAASFRALSPQYLLMPLLAAGAAEIHHHAATKFAPKNPKKQKTPTGKKTA